MPTLDIDWVRSQFPALAVQVNGRPVVYFDGPGGTQVPQRVIDAMRDYLMNFNANTHGAFSTSRKSDEVISEAHAAVADLLGCDADEVIFGPNMTSLTFGISRALGREFGPGDELVVTRLDHDGNVAPWCALENVVVGCASWTSIPRTVLWTWPDSNGKLRLTLASWRWATLPMQWEPSTMCRK